MNQRISSLPQEGRLLKETGTSFYQGDLVVHPPKGLASWLKFHKGARLGPSKGWKLAKDCGTHTQGFCLSGKSPTQSPPASAFERKGRANIMRATDL